MSRRWMNVSRESRSSAQASLRRRAKCSRSAADTLSDGETSNPMLVILPADALPIHLQNTRRQPAPVFGNVPRAIAIRLTRRCVRGAREPRCVSDAGSRSLGGRPGAIRDRPRRPDTWRQGRCVDADERPTAIRAGTGTRYPCEGWLGGVLSGAGSTHRRPPRSSRKLKN